MTLANALPASPVKNAFGSTRFSKHTLNLGSAAIANAASAATRGLGMSGYIGAKSLSLHLDTCSYRHVSK